MTEPPGPGFFSSIPTSITSITSITSVTGVTTCYNYHQLSLGRLQKLEKSKRTEASTRRPFSKEPPQVLSPPSWQLGLSEHGGNTRVYPIHPYTRNPCSRIGFTRPLKTTIIIFPFKYCHIMWYASFSDSFCVWAQLLLTWLWLDRRLECMDVDQKWMRLEIGYKIFKCEHTVSKFWPSNLKWSNSSPENKPDHLFIKLDTKLKFRKLYPPTRPSIPSIPKVQAMQGPRRRRRGLISFWLRMWMLFWPSWKHISSGRMWSLPKMRVAPNHQIIHLDRIFHDKPSSYWGSPILRTPHVLFSVALKSFSCGRAAGIETKFVPPGPPIGGTGRETTRVVNEKSLGETSLDLSSLCLRYVFPSRYLGKDSIWNIRSSPKERWQKKRHHKKMRTVIGILNFQSE